MAIQENLSEIIRKRKNKVPALQEKLKHLQGIIDEVAQIEQLQRETLENAEQLKLSDESRDAVYAIKAKPFEFAAKELEQAFHDTISRFQRDEISIAVVGGARQGKSQLLQTISGLDNTIIPAFTAGDCTGATSVIQNVPGSNPTAKLDFYSRQEIMETVQKYLDIIYGKNGFVLNRFEDIGMLSVSQLESAIQDGSPEKVKFDHLRKYIEHFDDWAQLVDRETMVISDPGKIQQYVAQHNGKTEGTPEREDYFKYLAVKRAVISCEFRNPEAGRIVLRDTIGLGDTAIGISDKMLETIRLDSDAAIVIRRPEVGVGKLDESDYSLYKQLNGAFESRDMEKWLFWLVNCTTADSPFGNNEERCKAYQKKLLDKAWNIADCSIVNVADSQAVNDEYLPEVLRMLIRNIDTVDASILSELDSQAEKAFAEFQTIRDDIQRVLLQSIDIQNKTDFLEDKWDEFYGFGFMGKIKDSRNKWRLSRKKPCEALQKKVNEIMENARDLVPSQETLQKKAGAGGSNAETAYTWGRNTLRTEFTKQFLDIDESVLREEVMKFKTEIVEILTSDEGGRLGRLMPVDDIDEWLLRFSDQYFKKEKYDEFRTAFQMLAGWQLTVRGFLMPKIRHSIDSHLNPEDTGTTIPKGADAAWVYRKLDADIRSVKEELEPVFGVYDDGEDADGEDTNKLFSDPNKAFYATIAEFYDRIGFSYFNGWQADKRWFDFFAEYVTTLWSNEFLEQEQMNQIVQKWMQLSDSFGKVTVQDFLAS